MIVSEFMDRYLKVYLSGREKPFVFPLPEAEYRRAYATCQLSPAATTSQFFCFEAVGGRMVAISLPDVDMMQLLWDVVPADMEGDGIDWLALQPDQEDDEAQKEDVELYFRGRAEPFVTLAADPKELNDLFVLIDAGEFQNDTFATFEDVDGEAVYFNPRLLQMITLNGAG